MKTTSRAPRDWYRIACVEQAPDELTSVDVYIYDEIGESWWGGISPRQLVDDIADLDVDTMVVHINSPGGAAWDGLTIMNALRAHPARVEVVVDGIAASAASVVAMAGDKITMNLGAQMMIHDASGGCWGPAALMEETAQILHKLSDSYADVYAARAGGTREAWRSAMQAESWYTAQEAVEVGLADEWDGTATVEEPAAIAGFDLSRFRYPGRAHAPSPQLAAHNLPVSSEPGNQNREETVVERDEFLAGIRERLGVTDADASEETLLAALDQALEENSSTHTINLETVVPDGAMLVDAAAFARLQEDAAQGAAAREQQTRERRDQIVATAVREGRIAPAARTTWRAQLDANEDGTAALLASLPKNTIPVTELGYTADNDDPESALYNAAFGTEKGA